MNAFYGIVNLIYESLSVGKKEAPKSAGSLKGLSAGVGGVGRMNWGLVA